MKKYIYKRSEISQLNAEKVMQRLPMKVQSHSKDVYILRGRRTGEVLGDINLNSIRLGTSDHVKKILDGSKGNCFRLYTLGNRYTKPTPVKIYLSSP